MIEIGPEKLSNLPRVTQLVRTQLYLSLSGIRVQALIPHISLSKGRGFSTAPQG